MPASMKRQAETQSFQEKYEQELKQSVELKETIRKLNERVTLMEKELAEAHQHTPLVSDLNLRTGKSTQKKRRIDEESPTAESKLSNETQSSENVNQEIKRLRKQNENLIERLHESAKALEDQQLKAAEESQKGPDAENRSLFTKIDKSIEEKFKIMESKLIDQIEKKISSKQGQNKSFVCALTGIENSEKNEKEQQLVPGTQNFRSLMMSARNEELAEEKDRNERSCNIIIHGKSESNEQKDDVEFVQTMVKVMECNAVEVKHVIRIGYAEENKKRPIKIVMGSEEQKEEILNNLRKLKNCEEFKGISITNDYTLSERQMIRKFVSQAKQKSLEEPEGSKFIWKVRGTPKNGLMIKRFTKVLNSQPATTQQ